MAIPYASPPSATASDFVDLNRWWFPSELSEELLNFLFQGPDISFDFPDDSHPPVATGDVLIDWNVVHAGTSHKVRKGRWSI